MSAPQHQRFPAPYSEETVNEIMNDIKLQHRDAMTSLDQWGERNYHRFFDNIKVQHMKWLEYLDTITNGKVHERATADCTVALNAVKNNVTEPITKKNINRPPQSMDILNFVKGIERRDADELTPEEFRKEYEYKSKPVIIKNCINDWPCKDWTLETLATSKWAKAKFRLGDDDEGYALRQPLDMYMQYLNTQKDDSPLYLFEDDFGEREASKDMVEYYTPPKYFSEDLFLLMAEARRPPFRWIIVGDKLCGTKVHIDPLGTSAWNAITCGIKRWVLFSPKLAAAIANGSFLYTSEEKAKNRPLEASEYFIELIPRMREWIAALPTQEQRDEYQMMECLQYKDEVIFVPNDWHHAVMNYEPAVSFTQNWASSQTFMPIWYALCKRRRNLARRLFDRIRVIYPDLAAYIEKESRANPGNHDYLYEPQNDPTMTPRRIRIYDSLDKHQKYSQRQLEFIRKLLPNFSVEYSEERQKEILEVLLQGNVGSSSSDDEPEVTTDEDEYE